MTDNRRPLALHVRTPWLPYVVGPLALDLTQETEAAVWVEEEDGESVLLIAGPADVVREVQREAIRRLRELGGVLMGQGAEA